MQKTAVTIFLFSALVLGCAGAAEREWNVYQPGNSACYIRLPANPEYQTQIVEAMTTHVYILKDTMKTPAFVYTIAFGDYPKEKLLEKDSPKKILDNERDSFARAVNGKILSEKPLTKDHFPGRSIVVSGEDGQARYLVHEFLADGRIFQLAVCVPAGMADDPDVAKFFDSFQLPKK